LGGGLPVAANDSQGCDSGVEVIEQLDANDVSPPAVGEVTSAADAVIDLGLRAEVCKAEFVSVSRFLPPIEYQDTSSSYLLHGCGESSSGGSDCDVSCTGIQVEGGDDDAPARRRLLEKYCRGSPTEWDPTLCVVDLIRIAESGGKSGQQVARGMHRFLKWKRRGRRGASRLPSLIKPLKALFPDVLFEPVVVRWESFKSTVAVNASARAVTQERLVQFLHAYTPDFNTQPLHVVLQRLTRETEAEMDGPWRLWHLFAHILGVCVRTSPVCVVNINDLRSWFVRLIDLFPSLMGGGSPPSLMDVESPSPAPSWDELNRNLNWIHESKRKLGLF